MTPTCPDCTTWPWRGPPCPMSWSPLWDTWSCLRCLDMPLKHWIVQAGKLVQVTENPDGTVTPVAILGSGDPDAPELPNS